MCIAGPSHLLQLPMKVLNVFNLFYNDIRVYFCVSSSDDTHLFTFSFQTSPRGCGQNSMTYLLVMEYVLHLFHAQMMVGNLQYMLSHTVCFADLTDLLINPF